LESWEDEEKGDRNESQVLRFMIRIYDKDLWLVFIRCNLVKYRGIN